MPGNFLDQLLANPHGLGYGPAYPTAPNFTYDEYGQPHDAQGNKIQQPDDPSLSDSLWNIGESPARLTTALASGLSPYGEEGWQVPPAIHEPVNALMRLAQNSRFEDGHLGIPNPQNLDNQHDTATLIESLFGGNATRGAGVAENAVARALPENAFAAAARNPALASDLANSMSIDDVIGHINAMRSDPLANIRSKYPNLPADFAIRETEPDIFTGFSGGKQAGYLNLYRHNADDIFAADRETTPEFQRRGVASAIQDYVENHLAQKLNTPSALTDEGRAFEIARARARGQDPTDLFSDTGKPSLLGAAVAGQGMPAEIASKVDWGGLDSLPKNQGVQKLGSADAAYRAGTFPAPNDYGDIPLDAYDTAALGQLWRDKVRRTGELYSDNLPSLWGNALSQDQNEPRNSLFTY